MDTAGYVRKLNPCGTGGEPNLASIRLLLFLQKAKRHAKEGRAYDNRSKHPIEKTDTEGAEKRTIKRAQEINTH